MPFNTHEIYLWMTTSYKTFFTTTSSSFKVIKNDERLNKCTELLVL